MTYNCEIYRSIHDVNPAAWAEICRDQHDAILMDIRFIATIEKTMAAGSSFRYVILRDAGGRPAACACLSTFRTDAALLADDPVKRGLGLIRKAVPSFARFTILFCGLPLSIGQHHIRFAAGVDRSAILARMDTLLLQFGTEEAADFLVYREFGNDYCQSLSYLTGRGYLRLDSLYTHNFKPVAPDFAGYCAMLKKKYRSNRLKSLRKFELSGCTSQTVRDPAAIAAVYTPQLHNLYEAVAAKAEYRLETLPADFFLELSRQFPVQVSLTLLYRQEEVIGLLWALHSETDYYLLFLGVDYSQRPEADTYFNLAYIGLDNALKQKVKTVQFGQTADSFKSMLGCYSEPRHFYIRGRKPLLHGVLRLLASRLFPTRSRPAVHAVYNSANAEHNPDAGIPQSCLPERNRISRPASKSNKIGLRQKA